MLNMWFERPSGGASLTELVVSSNSPYAINQQTINTNKFFQLNKEVENTNTYSRKHDKY